MLIQVIAKASETPEKPLTFMMSGSVDESIAAEFGAFVAHLRIKTGDNSIDVAFYRDGSIRAFVTGSSEGLAKLQELFESGELEELSNLPLQSLSLVDSSSSDARKLRLIKSLRLTRDLTHALDLTLGDLKVERHGGLRVGRVAG
jgi:hypothetical protein